MKLHRYVDHQRLHIVTKDVISLSISVLLLFRHYISHKNNFWCPQQWRGITQCLRCFYLEYVFLRLSKYGKKGPFASLRKPQ